MTALVEKIRWQRLAAIGLFSAGLAFAAALFVLPLVDDVATTRSQLERQTRALWQLKASLARLEAADAALTSEPTVAFGWTGGQIGEVSAMIQSRLSGVAREQGIRIRSVSSIPSEPLAETQTVGLRLEAEAPLDQIASYLRSIEGVTPLLLVKRLNLRRLNRPGTDALQPVVYLRLELVAPIILDAGGQTR